jgi:hypothetical protein
MSATATVSGYADCPEALRLRALLLQGYVVSHVNA